MKSWKTNKTGQIFYLLVFTAISFMILSGYILKGNRKNIDFTIESFLLSILYISPLFIGWVFVFSKFILKKKIPISIEHESDSENFVFNFKKGKKYILHRNDFSYSYYQYPRYCVLVINKKINSKRGHIINKELLSIVGSNFAFGWKKNVLTEIACYFDNNGIENIRSKDKTFIWRIVQ